jgi:hypothetical protein
MPSTNKNNNEISTIRVKKETKKLLDEFGNLSDTYETVIIKMVEHCKKCKRYKNGE